MTKIKRVKFCAIIKAPEDFSLYLDRKQITVKDSQPEDVNFSDVTIRRRGAKVIYEGVQEKLSVLLEKHRIVLPRNIDTTLLMRKHAIKAPSYHFIIKTKLFGSFMAYYSEEDATYNIKDFVKELRKEIQTLIIENIYNVEYTINPK